MTYFLQTDGRWANQTYDGKHIFKKYGCFVVSLSMLTDTDPRDTASVLQSHGCFNSEGKLNSECATNALGIEYNGKSSTFPEGYNQVIAETNYYKNSGIPQHFFIIDKDGKQYDPLGKDIKYPIVSYRLFKIKESEDNMNHEVIAETVRKVRRMVLTGNFDDAGSEADIKWVEAELAKGNKYAFEQLFGRYEKAGNFIGTSDCSKYTKGLNEIKAIVNNI